MTRIIRAQGAASSRRRLAPGATRVLRAEQLHSLGEAERILEGARAQARALTAQAAAEAVERRRQVEAESSARAAALLCRAEEHAAQIVRDARGELTTLAVRIAEKILGEQLRLEPDSVCSIVEQCLRAWPGPRQVRLRVNPADVPRLQSALPRLRGASSATLQICSDPEVAAGGCLLESELGEVDGRLEVQLSRLAEALK